MRRIVFLSWVFALTGLAADSALPWYMRETAMTPGGRLTFLQKSWWPRAQKLAEGQSFTLDLNRDGRPDTMIFRKDGNIVEAIDDSGKASNILNQADTAYVVSYKGTGIVDRMVVFTDNDQDGKADEMEIRYFKDGYLRWAWFGENYDGDGAQIFHTTNWEYDYDQFHSKFRGNVEFYANKYDPKLQKWVPASECPFAFGDPNHDGHGEWVVRVSAAPLGANTGTDLDYANNTAYVWEPEAKKLSDMGYLNIRLSFSLDPEPRTQPLDKPHYTFGFNLVGEQPYVHPRMMYTNPKRRPPQTVVRIPRTAALETAMSYPAQQTGFSWDEAHAVNRWEGQFWIYERRLMYNTGGPIMRWNMRREYSDKPTSERRLYYSEVDKRYHLFGAREGWMETGRLVNDAKDLEFRYFDQDGDGYFDTWQVFESGTPAPVRVSRVSNPRARTVKLSPEELNREYNGRVLPEAIAQNQRLISALKKVVSVPLAAQYEQEAAKTDFAERKRYCLDIARELYFLRARDVLYARNETNWYSDSRFGEGELTVRPGPIRGQYTLGDTLAYWKDALAIERFVTAYSDGDLLEAAGALERLTHAQSSSEAR